MEPEVKTIRKEYSHTLENNTQIKVAITCDIANYNKSDLRKLLKEIAVDSHNFYLDVGNELVWREPVNTQKENRKD